MNDDQAKEIITHLDDLKKLMILGLFDKGYKQGHIAKALGVSQPTISRMFPKGTVPKAKMEADPQ